MSGTEWAACALCHRQGVVQRRERMLPHRAWFGPRSPVTGEVVSRWECVHIDACRHARGLPPRDEAVGRQVLLALGVLALVLVAFWIVQGVR